MPLNLAQLVTFKTPNLAQLITSQRMHIYIHTYIYVHTHTPLTVFSGQRVKELCKNWPPTHQGLGLRCFSTEPGRPPTWEMLKKDKEPKRSHKQNKFWGARQIRPPSLGPPRTPSFFMLGCLAAPKSLMLGASFI